MKIQKNIEKWMIGEKRKNIQEKLAVLEEDEMEIDLKEIFLFLRHSWKAIFMAILIGAVCFGGYYTFLVTPSYEAVAEIYITNTDSMITFSDLQLSAALTDDYAQIIKSRTVIDVYKRQIGYGSYRKQRKSLLMQDLRITRMEKFDFEKYIDY